MENSSTKTRSIRIINITSLSIIYVTLSFLFSFYLNEMVGKLNKEEASKKSTGMLILEIYFYFVIISICAYIIRNIVKSMMITSYSYFDIENTRTSELNGGIIFAFAIFFFQENLKNKINYIFTDRLFKK